jgi:hypothetical protein
MRVIQIEAGMNHTSPFHRVETTVGDDGTLTLDDLPFRAGQQVEVLILPRADATAGRGPLHGTPVRYDRPFDPVADDEWAAGQ